MLSMCHVRGHVLTPSCLIRFASEHAIRYSSSCELVLAVKGQGVHGFTLDPLVGEFILTKPYMRIPEVCSATAQCRYR